MSDNLDNLRKVAEAATPGPWEAEPYLLSRLEQAERVCVKLMKRLDAMRRQRDGYRNQLRKTEQQIQRVRELNQFLPASIMERITRALDGDNRG